MAHRLKTGLEGGATGGVEQRFSNFAALLRVGTTREFLKLLTPRACWGCGGEDGSLNQNLRVKTRCYHLLKTPGVSNAQQGRDERK